MPRGQVRAMVKEDRVRDLSNLDIHRCSWEQQAQIYLDKFLTNLIALNSDVISCVGVGRTKLLTQPLYLKWRNMHWIGRLPGE